jgi:NADPH-dependent 2,4-dienoyl-CoA reductase/sulfur reductase-like enzyme
VLEAIRVDRQMRTNIADVLAAGDCVETWHRVLQKPTYLPLGTTAHKQGRIAGETAIGGTRIWIITEADRTVTTILLPEEY